MFERQIIDIVADRESGSSQLVDRIQRAFHCVENNHPDERQLRWAFGRLRHIDGSMVVVHHLLDTLEPAIGPTFFDSLRQYEREWGDLPRRVATRLSELRDWSNSNVLTHSRSGMLLEAIRRVTEGYEGVNVWQTRSEPGGEGVAQYGELQELGVAAHLVEDSQVPELASSMDAAWLGVDQYSEEMFVNKVGSKSVAEAMSRAGKTIFVLGDPRKRVNTLSVSSDLFEAVPFTRDTCLISAGKTSR